MPDEFADLPSEISAWQERLRPRGAFTARRSMNLSPFTARLLDAYANRMGYSAAGLLRRVVLLGLALELRSYAPDLYTSLVEHHEKEKPHE